MKKDSFIQRAYDLYDLTWEIHKHIASFPEVGWKEIETTKYLTKFLDEWGVKYNITKRGVGFIAVLEFENPDIQTVIYRFDIDQLPVPDEGEKLVISQNKGFSAACGHSAHAAIGMTALKIILENRSELKGRLVLVAQPAEEIVFDSGMKYLLDYENLLNFPNIIAAYGLHVTPEYQTGNVHIAVGEFMASVSELQLTWLGKSGHVQHQKQTKNTIHAAAEFITQMNIIRSAHSNPFDPLILSCTKIHSNTIESENSNVIPDTTWCTVVYRAFNENFRCEIRDRLISIAKNVADNYDQEVLPVNFDGIPPVKNDSPLSNWARIQLSDLLGETHVLECSRRMGGDDIGWLLGKIPGVYVRLGTGGEPAYEYPLHDKKFQVNPKALPIGVAAMSYLIYQQLSKVH